MLSSFRFRKVFQSIFGFRTFFQFWVDGFRKPEFNTDMVRAPQQKVKLEIASKASREISYSLREAARRLGCSHSHLSRVLRGQRASRSLIARFRQLPTT